MSENIVICNGYKEYPFVINFFRLRPEFSFSMLWLALLTTLVYTFVYTPPEIDESEFKDLGQFDMVDLQMPLSSEAVPEIKIPDPVQEEVKTEAKNNLRFGNSNGKWDPSALAATMPKPKVALPEFPAFLKNMGVEGVVILEVGIDENGNVVYGKIVKGVHPDLDKHVLDWARSAQFYPAIAPDGSSFKCRFFLPMKFMLE